MNEYKYKLSYINGSKVLTYEFPAAISADKLTYYLRDFLCGCSWSEEMVGRILRLEEDDV